MASWRGYNSEHFLGIVPQPPAVDCKRRLAYSTHMHPSGACGWPILIKKMIAKINQFTVLLKVILWTIQSIYVWQVFAKFLKPDDLHK